MSLLAAEEHLLGLHRFLFPERYTPDTPVFMWTADTLEHVADMIEAALDELGIACSGLPAAPQSVQGR